MAIEFNGIAYSGEVIEDYAFPVIVDISSLELPPRIPVLFGHDPDEFIGNAVPAVEGGRLIVRGSLTDTLPRVADIVSAASDGLPWQLSVGITGDIRESAGGEVINGVDVPEGVYILAGGRLREVSVVPVGADHRTEMKIAAAAGSADILITFEARGGIMNNEDAKQEIEASVEAAELVQAAQEPAQEPEQLDVCSQEPASADVIADAASVISDLRSEIQRLREQVAQLQAEAMESKIEAELAKHAGDLPDSIKALIRAAAGSPEDIEALAKDARTGVEMVAKSTAKPVDISASGSVASIADMMRKFINK